jgi:hypothetical protein
MSGSAVAREYREAFGLSTMNFLSRMFDATRLVRVSRSLSLRRRLLLH